MVPPFIVFYSTYAFLIVTLIELEAFNPSLSVTVRVAVYVPLELYWCDTFDPLALALPAEPSPKLQE